mgnify:CR=1 FL=1
MEARGGVLGEPWRAWLVLGVGVLAVSAHSASSLAVSVLMKPILADLHLERAAFATAATVRMLAMVVAMSVAGQLTDRFGARLVLGGGALIVGLGNLATARVGSLWELYPVMAFIGPGQAACCGSSGAVADWPSACSTVATT